MEDTQLLQQLRSLGIDAETWQVVTLLPLVEVAWADGRVQDAERARIVRLAGASEALAGDGRLVLEGWLSYRPSPAYFARGRSVLRALLARPEAQALPVGNLHDACIRVAEAAGGLFGVVATIDAKERALLAEMARELPETGSWSGETPGPVDPPDVWPDDDPTETDLQPVSPTVPAGGAPPPRSEGPHLIVEGRGRTTRVALGTALRVGRGADNDLVVSWDAQVSRRHCTLYTEAGRWYVVDAGAANGTHVDGERVLERRLFGGETLQVGGTQLRFCP